MCVLVMSEEITKPPSSTLDPKLGSMLDIEDAEDKRFIYCATCSEVITTAAQRIEMQGGHTHNFTNPHGIPFHLGCFGNALGCEISGVPEAADSWFMGYFWRLASCAECHTHLGWFFARSSGEDSFYGLILDHIQEDTSS